MRANGSGSGGEPGSLGSRWRLHRLDVPDQETPTYFLAHGLFSLATQRPDLYLLSSERLPARGNDTAEGRLALVIRATGDLPGQLGVLLRLPAVAALLEEGVPLILDNSAEAGFVTAEAWGGFRAVLEALGLRSLRLLVLQQHAGTSADCAACFADHPRLKVEGLPFHYWLHRMVQAFRALDWQAYGRARRLPSPRARLLCLNGRPRSHRALVVGWLRVRDRLAHSLVSIKELPLTTDLLETCRQQYPDWSREREAYAEVMTSGLRLDGDVRILGGVAGGSLLPHHHSRTCFSLVTETEMSLTPLRRFTEKSLRPLACFHPILVAGNAGTLALLRGHGFHTFRPWIDERYDDELDRSRRLRMVLEETERLLGLDEHAFARLLAGLEPILRHNHDHFRTGLETLIEAQHRDLQAALERLAAEGTA